MTKKAQVGETDGTAFDPAELRAMARDLIASWDERPGQVTFNARREPASFTVLAFANHVHRLAPRIVDLLEDGLLLEATPLLRLAYETSITAQWLWLFPDAIAAFANEGMRQRRAVAETLRKTTFASATEMAAAVTKDLPDDRVPSNSDPAGKHFYQRCLDMKEAGEDAYALYRLLSQYSHPSMYLSDFYLRRLPDESLPSLEFNEAAQLDTHLSWAHLTCACLVWAGRAVDMADRQRPRREQLRSAAKRLGVPVKFSMSKDAWLRTQLVKKPRRHSN